MSVMLGKDTTLSAAQRVQNAVRVLSAAWMPGMYAAGSAIDRQPAPGLVNRCTCGRVISANKDRCKEHAQ